MKLRWWGFRFALVIWFAVLLLGCDAGDRGRGSVDPETGQSSFSVSARNGSPEASDDFSRETYIKASNANLADFFGWSVALDGDTLAVGAYGEASLGTGIDVAPENDFGFNSGAVYVFIRDGESWSEQAYIKPSNTGVGDTFGTSVALSGDTLVVGSYGEDSIATGVDGDQLDDSMAGSGAVYVFVRRGGLWSQQAYLKASDSDEYDRFGYSVAISGDTIAVGAINEDSSARGIAGDAADDSAVDSGAVYIFRRDGDSWSQRAYLKAANSDAGDRFGYSLAFDRDILAVGAIDEDGRVPLPNDNGTDNSVPDSGAVYIFRNVDESWQQRAYLKAANAGAGDRFGRSVAVDGNIIVVGASNEDSGIAVDGTADDSAADSGAVYVFQRDGNEWLPQAYLKSSNPDAGDYFGRSVSVAGDLLAVGAYGEDSGVPDGDGPADNGKPDSGAVYLFRRGDSGWSQQGYFKASNADSGDFFGWAVALSGGNLAITALLEDSTAQGIDGDPLDNGAPDSGAAYLRH